MKRHGELWERIISFENLLDAAGKAQRGKRYRDNVLVFNHDLEMNLLSLRQELTEQTYVPGSYRTFQIVEPKRRTISAAPYRDRVVHHALCNVIVPIFDWNTGTRGGCVPGSLPRWSSRCGIDEGATGGDSRRHAGRRPTHPGRAVSLFDEWGWHIEVE